MSSQPPTRYENYPPEQGDAPAGTPDDQLPDADVQRASMSGTGKFHGKAGRLLAELWIDDTGSGLLTTRILTALPSSAVSGEAQQMVDEMSQGF